MNEIIYQKSYKDYKAELDAELSRTAEGFVRIGYLLRLARDTDILRESGYANVNDFARAEYNIDKTMVSRFIGINERFSENGSDRLRQEYRGVGYAKLSIMLTLPEEITEEVTELSKSELQTIKEEYDEEQKITDLEVLMEEPGKREMTGNLAKALYEVLSQDQDMYSEIFHIAVSSIPQKTAAGIRAALAPAGERIFTVRIPGQGKYMLKVKDEDVSLINMRSLEKESFPGDELIAAVHQMIYEDKTVAESWRLAFGTEYEKGEIAPVQQIRTDATDLSQAEIQGFVEEAERISNRQQDKTDREPKKDIKKTPKVVTVKKEKPAEHSKAAEPKTDIEPQIEGQANIEDYPEYMPHPVEQEDIEQGTEHDTEHNSEHDSEAEIDSKSIDELNTVDENVDSVDNSPEGEAVSEYSEDNILRGYKAAVTNDLNRLRALWEGDKTGREELMIAVANNMIWRLNRIKAMEGGTDNE